MKKFISYLLGLVLMLSLMIFALIFFLEPIVEYAVPKIASRYGMQIDNLQIDRLTSNQLMIARLDANYSQEDLSVNIVAKDILLNIGISRVIQSGIKNIQIDELAVHISSHSNESGGVSQEQTLREIIADVPSIPFNINKLKLSYALNDQKIGDLRAKVALQSNHFNFDGQVTSPSLPLTQVDIEVSSQGNVALKIIELNSQDNIINWQGSLSVNNKQLLIAMHGDTSFASIQKYLNTAYLAPLTISKDNSFTKIDMQIDLDESIASFQESLVIKLHLDTQAQLDLSSKNIEQIQLDAEIGCMIKAMQNLACILEQPVRAKVLLQDSLLLVEEYFASDEEEYLLELVPLDQLAIQMQLKESNEIHITGAIKAQIKAAQSPLELNIQLAENQWHFAENLSFSTRYKTEILAENLLMPIAVNDINIGIQGYMDFDGSRLDMQIDKNAQVILNKVVHEDVAVDRLAFSLSKPFSVQYVVDGDELSIEDVFVSLTPGRITVNNVVINTGYTYLKISDIRQADAAWIANLNTTMNELAISQPGIDLKLFDINSFAALKKDQVSLDGKMLISDDQIVLEYQGFHNISRQQGSLKAALNDFPLAKSQLAKQLIKTSGLPMQVKTGDVGLVADLVWGAQIEDGVSLQADLQLRNIDGYYAQNNFTGLNAIVAVAGWKSWALTRPVSLRIDEFNIGFPVTDISLDITEVKKPLDAKALVEVDEFSAQALDGSVLAKEFEIDFNRAVNEFTIYLFNLSLEKLLALNQTEDLIVNGIFNGELPVRLENDRLSIKNGWLKVNENGGIIKYTRTKDILGGDSNVELLAELLDNFHYQQLSAELNMQPDGETILAATILGSNPNIENGGEVSLNPNIEINLLKMLYNIRLLSRVAEEITDQVIENEAVK